MFKVTSHNQNDNSFFQEFLNTDFAHTYVKQIEAGYMERLKTHIEEQRNSGRFSSVNDALDDFATRLAIPADQKTILAGLVARADLTEKQRVDKLKEEIDTQGAPASILPGVKPSKNTNKQQLNEELAESNASDSPEMPGNSSTGMKAVSQMLAEVFGSGDDEEFDDEELDDEELDDEELDDEELDDEELDDEELDDEELDDEELDDDEYYDSASLPKTSETVQEISKEEQSKKDELASLKDFSFLIEAEDLYLKVLVTKRDEQSVEYSVNKGPTKQGKLSIASYPEIKGVVNSYIKLAVNKQPEKADYYKSVLDDFMLWLSLPVKTKVTEIDLLQNIPLGLGSVEKEDELLFEQDNLIDVLVPEDFESSISEIKEVLEDKKSTISKRRQDPISILSSYLKRSSSKEDAVLLGLAKPKLGSVDKNYKRAKQKAEKTNEELERAFQLRSQLTTADFVIENLKDSIYSELSIDDKIATLELELETLSQEEVLDEAASKKIKEIEVSLIKLRNLQRSLPSFLNRFNLSLDDSNLNEKLSGLKEKVRDSLQRIGKQIADKAKEKVRNEEAVVLLEHEHHQLLLKKALDKRIDDFALSEKEIKRRAEEAVSSPVNREGFLRTFSKGFGPKPTSTQLKVVSTLRALLSEDFAKQESVLSFGEAADYRNFVETEKALKAEIKELEKGEDNEEEIEALSLKLDKLQQDERYIALKQKQDEKSQELDFRLAQQEHSNIELQSLISNILESSSFLRLTSEDLPKIYEEELQANAQVPEGTEIIPRKLNQFNLDGVEYVTDFETGERIYTGALPQDELVRSEMFLLYDIKEGNLLTDYREEALSFADTQRTKALTQLSSEERSKLKELYKLPEEEQAALLNDLRAKLEPDLRGYLYPLNKAFSEVLSDLDLERIIRLEILPNKKRDLGIQRNVDNEEDYLKLLRKKAIAKGFALQSYDVTLADATNTLLQNQCSALINACKNKKNAYDRFAERSKQKGTLVSYTHFTHDYDSEQDKVKKRAALPKHFYLENAEATKQAQEFHRLLDKLLTQYEMLLEKEIQNDLEINSLDQSKFGLKSENRVHRILSIVHKKFDLLIAETIKGNVEIIVGVSDDSNYISEVLELFKARFKRVVRGRLNEDKKVINNRIKETSIEKFSTAAAYLFEDTVKDKDHQLVIPVSYKQHQITPELLSKQIVRTAKMAGKDINTYQTNQLLSDVLIRIYEKAADKTIHNEEARRAFLASKQALVEATGLFPKNKEEKQTVLDLHRDMLSEQAREAVNMGAKGAILGSNIVYYAFLEPPETEDVRIIKPPQGVKKVADFISFRIPDSNQELRGVVGSSEVIHRQLEVMKQADLNVHLKILDSTEVVEEEILEYLAGHLATEEATHLLNKAFYKETSRALHFSLDDFNLTPNEFLAIWESTVVAQIKDSLNPLGLSIRPGPPPKTWKKSRSSNFLATGNSWNIGSKRSLYENQRREQEKLYEENDDHERKANIKFYNKEMKILRAQQTRMENFNQYVATYTPMRRALLRPISTFLPPAQFKNSQLLKTADFLLQVMAGKIESEQYTPEQAKERLLTFTNEALQDIFAKQERVEQSGKMKVTVELTCPLLHENPTSIHRLTVLPTPANSYLYGRPTDSEFDKGYLRKKWLHQGLLAGEEDAEVVQAWAQSVFDTTELGSDKSLAKQYMEKRYLIVGGAPKCPVCGAFTFENIDEEIEQALTKAKGQKQTNKLIKQLPQIAYVFEITEEEALESYTWLRNALAWLRNPNNAKKTRAEAYFDLTDIEALAVAKADQARKGKQVITDPETQQITTKVVQNSYLDLIRQIYAEGPEVDTETDVLYKEERVLWQIDLIDFFDKWRKHLEEGYGFVQSFEVATEKTLDETIVQKQPIFTEGKEGICIGFEGTNPILYKPKKEDQLSFLYKRTFNEEGEEEVELAGRKQYVGRAYALYDRLRAAQQLLMDGPITEKTAYEFVLYVRELNLNSPKGLDPLISIICPVISRDVDTLAYQENRELQSLIKFFEDISLPNLDEGMQDDLEMQGLLDPRILSKVESLQNLLRNMFPGLTAQTSLASYQEQLGNDEVELMVKRLEGLDLKKEVNSLLEMVDNHVYSGNEIINTQRFREDIDRKAKKVLSFYKELVVQENERAKQEWNWLTNKIIRFKQGGILGKQQIKIAPDKSAMRDMSEEELQELSQLTLQDIKDQLKLNTYPSLEEIQSVFADPCYRLRGSNAIEEENDLLTVERNVLLIQAMLTKLDSSRSQSDPKKNPAPEGERQKTLREFYDALVLENFDETTSAARRASFDEQMKTVVNLFGQGTDSYVYTDAVEIRETIADMLSLQKRSNKLNELLRDVSEKLVDLNAKCEELEEVLIFLQRYTNKIQDRAAPRVDKNAPDPRFFYRVKEVKSTSGVEQKATFIDCNFNTSLDEFKKLAPMFFEQEKLVTPSISEEEEEEEDSTTSRYRAMRQRALQTRLDIKEKDDGIKVRFRLGQMSALLQGLEHSVIKRESIEERKESYNKIRRLFLDLLEKFLTASIKRRVNKGNLVLLLDPILDPSDTYLPEMVGEDLQARVINVPEKAFAPCSYVFPAQLKDAPPYRLRTMDDLKEFYSHVYSEYLDFAEPFMTKSSIARQAKIDDFVRLARRVSLARLTNKIRRS